jgi:sugar lactone lactonase YvrE
MSAADVIARAQADLGEGPLWDPDRGRLLWLDILRGEIHALDPLSGDDACLLRFDEPVPAVALRASGGLVVALERGFALLAPGAGADAATRLGDVLPADSGLRFNDGACDPDGRFWSGTLRYDGAPGGAALHVLEPDRTVATALHGLSLSNGLAWSDDGRMLFHVDTATGGVDAYPRDGAARLGRRRRIVDIPGDAGAPDGMCLDAEGYLWVALWDGGAVHRYAPDGTLLRRVELPISRPTSCAFGDGHTLFVTSARHGLSDAQLEREPLAGAVFALDAGVTGASVPRFAG